MKQGKNLYDAPKLKELVLTSKIALLSGSGTGEDWEEGGDE